MTTYDRKLIEDEYNQASGSEDEFEKVKWGSREKMYNRFKLALNLFDFGSFSAWLDIGSGTGAFQSVVCSKYPRIRATGIDMSSNLTEFARKRKDIDQTKVNFVLGDFLEYNGGSFDFISCVGVLQKTNIAPEAFFARVFEKLNPGGYLFLDTKNANWEKFEEPDFFPEDTHHWFDANELIAAAEKADFSQIEVGGFIPGENKVVQPNQSHTIYLKATKLK